MKKKLSIALILSIIFLSACSNESQSLLTERNSENSASTSIDTNGVLIPIESTNVKSAGYDSDSKIMTVHFLSGSTYQYFEVPPTLWEEFLAAQPHPWSQVGYPQLVQGGYRYNKI